MPRRICAEPGCPRPARMPNPRGDEHARKVERERSQRRRDETGARVYDLQRWRMTRRRVLFEQPICAACDNALSVEVDHVVPLADGGDPFKRSNLAGICADCHRMKTAAENALRGEGRVR